MTLGDPREHIQHYEINKVSAQKELALISKEI